MRLNRTPRRSPLSVLTLCAAALSTVAPATAQDEDGPALQRAREFLAVLNDGSASAIETFVVEVFNDEFREGHTIEEHVQLLTGVHTGFAPLEIREVTRVSGESAQLLLHSEATDEWMSLGLIVEAEPPHLVASIRIAPGAAPPAAARGDRYADDEIRAEMRSFLDEMIAADRFSGTVMLVRDGEVVFEAVHGEANKDFGVPNRIDTKFNLGSMNKMFTAVAIAQLVESSELAWDDPLSKFVPDFPDPESAAKIRIEHLLTHTGGLGSYFNETFMNASRARFRTVQELMTLAEGETLRFEPGTRWSYSNTGFLVLGRVIEVVTGQDYHDYIREHVTGPAGMTSTDCYELDRVNDNLAVGYDRQDGEWRNNIFMHVIRGGPAGGGYSTVGDLVRFAAALRNGTLVSRETFARMVSPKPELGSDAYGYGFGIGPEGGVGHSGGFMGISAQLEFWPDGEWTIAVMSNYSGGASPVVQRARRLIGPPDGSS